MRAAVVVVAGGSGSRVGSTLNKAYLPIRTRPMLAYSLSTLGSSALVHEIVLVIREQDRTQAQYLVDQFVQDTPVRIAIGGASRHASEQAGIDALASEAASGAIDLILVHDAARPFITEALLSRVIDTAAKAGGAIPALGFDRPIYAIDDGTLTEVDRSTVARAQTPQGFHARPLVDAYRAAAAAGFEGLDTAETVERFSDLTIAVVSGETSNLKVTFPEDFRTAEAVAREWDASAPAVSPGEQVHLDGPED